MPSGGHVTEATRACLDLTDPQRIAKINRDVWIGYDRAGKALRRCLEIHEGSRSRDSLLIVGPSNNGKTMIFRRFLSQTWQRQQPRAEVSDLRVLGIAAPNGADEKGLLLNILEAAAAPVDRKATTRDLKATTYDLVRRMNLRILLIDDLHMALRGSRKAVGQVLGRLKLLGDELGVSIIAFGTREALYAVQTEEQFKNRFPPFPLPRWELGDPEYWRLLNSFARFLPLREPSELDDTVLGTRILARAEGLIGGVAEVIRLCAVEAIRSGAERITPEVLERIAYIPPSQRESAASLGIE
jgi:hypothetical protein